MQIKELIDYLDYRFPYDTASDFDTSIGFAIGSKSIEVNKVLLALDLTLDVAKEAKEKGCNLIITHHPFLFNPINKIIFDSPQGTIIKFLCDNNISIYSMHTNLDVAVGGVNDSLAKMLGIEFNHTEALKDNMLVYGKIKACCLEDLVKKVKDVYKLSGVRVVGDLNKKINMAGVIGGAGASIYNINDAIKKGCDVLITGEVHLDKAIYASNLGFSIIEVNHGVERFVFDFLINELKDKFGDIFLISNINTDPLISM